jgi:hypothetical protein
MVYESLKLSTECQIDYQEIDEGHRSVPNGYDLYVFNYHDTTMGWLDTAAVRSLPGTKATVVLEISPNDPFVRVSEEDFDAFIVLDPSMGRLTPKVFPFPRPLEPAPAPESVAPLGESRPVIGTFGLPTRGKGFNKIFEAVNDEFDSAVIRMNIPRGDFVPKELQLEVEAEIDRLCRSAGAGIEVWVTRDFMDKSDLVKWCAQNTLNVFLYDRSMTGLAATTDQAISSGQPLAVSANETFRHVHQYLKPYPFRSLASSIRVSRAEVERMREAWSQRAFAQTFDEMLLALDLRPESPRSGETVLPTRDRFSGIRRLRRRDLVPPVLDKAAARLRRRFVQPVAAPAAAPGPKAFVSPMLSSFSALGEDLWLDLILGAPRSGYYVEIREGQAPPGSHTLRFHRRGWNGINVSASERDHAATLRERPDALNLHLTLNGHATLGDLLRDHAAANSVDLLALYTTQPAADILKNNDWSVQRPTAIVVPLRPGRSEVVQILQRNDYALVINNDENGVFVDTWTTKPEVRRLFAADSD